METKSIREFCNVDGRIELNAIFEILRFAEIIYKDGKINVPYKKYLDYEYFQLREMTIHNKKGEEFLYWQIRVTPLGEKFLTDKIDKLIAFIKSCK